MKELSETWGAPTDLSSKGEIVCEYKRDEAKWDEQSVAVFTYNGRFGFCMSINTTNGGFSWGPFPKFSPAFDSESAALEVAVDYAIKSMRSRYRVHFGWNGDRNFAVISKWLEGLIKPVQLDLFELL